MDIFEDCWREERGLSAVVLMDFAAKGGGADVVVEIGEEIEVGLGSDDVAKAVMDRLWGLNLRLALADERDGSREACGELGGGEALAGTRGDDESGEKGKIRGTMPARQRAEGVGSEKEEELRAGWKDLAKLGQGIDCVIWRSVGLIARSGAVGVWRVN